MKKIIKFCLIAILAFSPLTSYSNVFAAGASISAAPSSGSHQTGEEFQITIAADGGGQNFTSFGASVSVSNLKVVSLAKGPVSLWTTTPAADSLNFFGGVSNQLQNITVYTLTVSGIAAGTATVDISGGVIKTTDGYTTTDLPTQSNGASFTISGQTSSGSNSSGDSGSSTSSSSSSSSSTSSTSTKPKTATTPSSSTSKTTAPVQTQAPAQTNPVVQSLNLPQEEPKLVTVWHNYAVNQDINVALDSKKSVFNYNSNQLEKAYFSGKASPNALVILYVFSDLSIGWGQADATGHWSVEVDKPFAIGTHHVYATEVGQSNIQRTSDAVAFDVKASLFQNNQETKSTLSKQQIYMISGGIILIILIILIIIFFKRRKKNIQTDSISNGNSFESAEKPAPQNFQTLTFQAPTVTEAKIEEPVSQSQTSIPNPTSSAESSVQTQTQADQDQPEAQSAAKIELDFSNQYQNQPDEQSQGQSAAPGLESEQTEDETTTKLSE